MSAAATTSCSRKSAAIHRHLPRCRGWRACRSKAGLCKRVALQVSEFVMSHRLRPLRLFVLCCAAAVIAAPLSAQQPAAPQGQTPQGQAPSAAPPKPPAGAPAKPPAQAAQPAQPLKDPVVAIVNGQPIRLSELEVAQQSLPQQYRNMPLQAVFPA